MNKSISLRALISGASEPSRTFAAVRTLEVELSEPLASVSGESEAGPAQYSAARVLVRLHHHPIGFVEVAIPDGLMSPSELEQRIWDALGPAILTHLTEDGSLKTAEDHRPELPIAGHCEMNGERPDWFPFVSVVICTVSRPRQLRNALDALLRLEYPNFEIVVVDNAPEDTSTANMIRDQFSGQSKLRYEAEPLRGLSAARNRAINVAKGEILAFTDDDIIVDRFWLSSLVSGFDVEGKVACVTGLTLASELESSAQSMFERYGAFNKGYESRLFKRDVNPASTILYPYTAGVFGGGGNSALRLACFPEGLRFDQRLGPGSMAFGAEDLDIFLETILKGRYIRYVPRAIAWHEHRRSYQDLRWQLFTYGAGFTALMTKWSLKDFRIATDLLRLAPKAIFSSLRPGTAREGGSHHLPGDLRRVEVLGYFYGPIAYARSVLRLRSQANPKEPK